jgi:hypothetical protein
VLVSTSPSGFGVLGVSGDINGASVLKRKKGGLSKRKRKKEKRERKKKGKREKLG